MALFKILKGQASNLTDQAKKEGYAWFTTDEGKLYIDASDSERIALNANKADLDSEGNNIIDTYATKEEMASKVQIITWEDDD